MARAKGSSNKNVTDNTSILDSFSSISQSDKKSFKKKAVGYGVSEEELLAVAVQAVINDKIPIKKRVFIELDMSEKEEPAAEEKTAE